MVVAPSTGHFLQQTRHWAWRGCGAVLVRYENWAVDGCVSVCLVLTIDVYDAIRYKLKFAFAFKQKSSLRSSCAVPSSGKLRCALLYLPIGLIFLTILVLLWRKTRYSGPFVFESILHNWIVIWAVVAAEWSACLLATTAIRVRILC